MGLSRLDNFLKNVKGEIIYVDSNNIDSTDSVENQGNSLARPFKTLQRALVEAARFSYQGGKSNDRFNKTTIVLYPGNHYIDNRPGWIPDGQNNFILRGGVSSTNFFQFSSSSNFDLTNSSNDLYKLNSVHGGVIIPRGTSIVGMDLRKTKIIPRYVPNPENDNIERSAIFRVTGACYFWQISILDSDINDFCYKDYTTNKFVGEFSHHKLTAFEYADGVNPVVINDEFVTYSSARTDLDMYYEKVGLCFGISSGRNIPNDYPSQLIDIQPRVEEYRIVGTRSGEVGISSIRAGDGINPNTTITAILSEPLDELDVDSIIRVEGINASGYDGEHVVTKVISPTQVQYQVETLPFDANPSTSGATINIIIDTVDSASPYIFNCSLRSVYGLCGLHADGSKASGFKSMVVAQFTGIGLQKDNNAFVKYNEFTGNYDDNTAFGNENIYTDSRAKFKPSYENYHIKCSNDGYIQVVSVFAIGYASHFLAESGGDQSINNSNSNFGSRALVASGYRQNAFPKDDIGYITHIVPPEHLELERANIEFYSIDVSKSIADTTNTKLYLYGETNKDILPEDTYQGYKIGAKNNDRLNLIIGNTTHSAKIVMPNTQTSSRTSSSKESTVSLTIAGISSVTNNVLTFTENHEFLTGESVKVFSDNGDLPIGLESERLYYAIASGSSITNTQNQIKLASTLEDALNDNEISINSNGGVLRVISRVSDKVPGEIGHPIQYDSSVNNWFLTVSNITSGAYPQNSISPAILANSASLGSATSRTFFNRIIDDRNLSNRIYQVRYVMPSDSPFVGRPPLEGYVIQESNSTIGQSDAEIEKAFSLNSVSLNNSTELRNFRIISNASWSSGIATFTTEIPHDLIIGSTVEVVSVASTNNTGAIDNLGYNGTFSVSGISTSYNTFSVNIGNNPGVFVGSSSLRNTNIPRFKKKTSTNTFIVYRSEEIQEYIKGKQDGIYNLTLLNASNSPKVNPFKELSFLQPVINLYPQVDRDNPISDPKESKSHALSDVIGKVVLNNPQNSETKETLNKFFLDLGKSNKIKSFIKTITLNDSLYTIETEKNHGLNKITSVSITTFGTGYGTGVNASFYGAKLTGGSGSDATALVSVNSTGQLTGIRIINGGSGYTLNDVLTVSGISTFAPFSAATVTVSSISNNVGDVIQIEGTNYKKYNTLAQISLVESPNRVRVILDNSHYHQYIKDIGTLDLSSASYTLTGNKSYLFQTAAINYTQKTITLTLRDTHPFKINDIVNISNNNYNTIAALFTPQNTLNLERNFRVIQTTSTSITVFIGDLIRSDEIYDQTQLTIPLADKFYFWVSLSGFSSKFGSSDEINSRLIPIYGGSTGTVSAITSRTTDQITITSLSTLGLNIGDYLQIENEIVRIKDTVSTSPLVNLVSVYRGVLGSKSSTYTSGTVIKKINPIPIEFRRNSLIRASAHTFEYVGFGPGNYSTAFPEKQDRKLSEDEEKLAHSLRIDGGVSVFSSMNADGNFYIGNKKINSASAREETFDIPVPSNVGENDYSKPNYNIIKGDKLSISKAIKVEGGKNSKELSEFNGEVLFTNKVTSTSIKGLEAISVYLQGDETISRKYTISASQPILSGNPGDIVFKSSPADTKEIGWLYTSANQWESFGSAAGIKLESDNISPLEKFITFSDVASSQDEIEVLKTSSNLKFQPSTGKLSSTVFSGSGFNLTNVYPRALKPKSEDRSSGIFNYIYETDKTYQISGTDNIEITSSGSTYGNTIFTSLDQITVDTNGSLVIGENTTFKMGTISNVFAQSDDLISGTVDTSLTYTNGGTIASWNVGQRGISDAPNYDNDAFSFVRVNPTNASEVDVMMSISSDGILGVNCIETMYAASAGSIDLLQAVQVRPRPGQNGAHLAILAKQGSRGPAELRVWNGGNLAEWLLGQRSEIASDFTISKLLSNNVTEMFSISTDGVVGIHTITNMINVENTNVDIFQSLRIDPRPGQTGTQVLIKGEQSSPTELRIYNGGNVSEWLIGQRPAGITYDYAAFRISKLSSNVVTTMLSVSADGIIGIHTTTNMDGISNTNIDTLQTLKIDPRPGQNGVHLMLNGKNSNPTELRIWSGNNISEWLIGQRNLGTTFDYGALRFSSLATGVVTTILSVSADGIVGVNTITNMANVNSATNIDGFQSMVVAPRPGENGTHLLILGRNTNHAELRIWNGNNVTEWLVGQRSGNSTFTISTLASQSVTTRFTFTNNGVLTASSFNPTSDVNLKKNINEIESPLDIIDQIRGVNFEWKENDEKSIGVIAQEVEKVLPELVGEENETKNVNYNGLVAVLIECVKEQQKQINELKNQIKNL